MQKLLPIFLLAMLLLGCGKIGNPITKKDSGRGSKEFQEEIIIPVEAHLAERGDISAHFETTTRIVAENRVEVVAEAIGECVKVNVEEGDRVQQGQVLAELDKKDALANLRQLEIQVAQAKSSYEIAEHSLAEGLGAKVERDNAKFSYDQALANLKAQRLQVEKLTIKAPISGVITQRAIQEGQMVATATPLFSIVDPESFVVEIRPPEKELSRLRKGQRAKVTIDALENEEFVAHVRRINPAVDPMTGTIKVILDFEEGVHDRLRDSAFARVRLIMETHEHALIVPKDVLVEESGRKYVFVVREEEPKEAESGEEEPSGDAEEVDAARAVPGEADTDAQRPPEGPSEKPKEPRLVAHRVEVQTGLEDSNYIEITSGIDDDSLIVTLGQHTLKDDARVRITTAEAEIAAKADLSVEEALMAAEAKRAREREREDRAEEPPLEAGK